MTNLPDYQTIEEAYKAVSDVIGRLPKNDWTGRSLDNLEISKQAAYQARERAKADRTEDAPADASVSLRGPAPLIWPWPWPRSARCSFASEHCSCGAKG